MRTYRHSYLTNTQINTHITNSLQLTSAENEISELRPMIPLLQKEAADAKATCESMYFWCLLLCVFVWCCLLLSVVCCCGFCWMLRKQSCGCMYSINFFTVISLATICSNLPHTFILHHTLTTTHHHSFFTTHSPPLTSQLAYKLQNSTSSTVNGLLEEVRKAEAEAAKEKKKGAQEVSS